MISKILDVVVELALGWTYVFILLISWCRLIQASKDDLYLNHLAFWNALRLCATLEEKLHDTTEIMVMQPDLSVEMYEVEYLGVLGDK